MPTIKHKPACHLEAKRLIRLTARSKTNGIDEPSLRHLTPMQIEMLQEYIAECGTRQMVVGMNALLWVVLLTLLILQGKAFGLPFGILSGLALLFIFGFCMPMHHRNAVYALTQTDDLRVLPTLVQATKHHWGQHPQVKNAIERLLSQVTEENAGLLNNAQQKALWNISLSRIGRRAVGDTNFGYCTLCALSLIGNRETLARMQQLANEYPNGLYNIGLAAEAQKLLPIMEARLKRQEVPETLLRAAHPPHSQTEILLRPANAVTSEPPDQLLRAGTQDK